MCILLIYMYRSLPRSLSPSTSTACQRSPWVTHPHARLVVAAALDIGVDVTGQTSREKIVLACVDVSKKITSCNCFGSGSRCRPMFGRQLHLPPELRFQQIHLWYPVLCIYDSQGFTLLLAICVFIVSPPLSEGHTFSLLRTLTTFSLTGVVPRELLCCPDHYCCHSYICTAAKQIALSPVCKYCQLRVAPNREAP